MSRTDDPRETHVVPSGTSDEWPRVGQFYAWRGQEKPRDHHRVTMLVGEGREVTAVVLFGVPGLVSLHRLAREYDLIELCGDLDMLGGRPSGYTCTLPNGHGGEHQDHRSARPVGWQTVVTTAKAQAAAVIAASIEAIDRRRPAMPPEAISPTRTPQPTVLIFRSGRMEVAYQPEPGTFTFSIAGFSRTIDRDEACALLDALTGKLGDGR